MRKLWSQASVGTFEPGHSTRCAIITYRFAGILVFTSAKLLQEDGEEEDEDLSDNAIVKMTRSMITTVDYYDGNKFFTEVSELLVGWRVMQSVACVDRSPTHLHPCPSMHVPLYRWTGCAWRRRCWWCSSASS